MLRQEEELGRKKQAATAYSWCERNLNWNVALRMSIGRWEQEEDVGALAGQQVGIPIQQIAFTLHSILTKEPLIVRNL